MRSNPEGIRQRRLREIVVSLQKAKGKWVRLSSFIGTICYKTGATPITIRDYFDVLVTADILQIDRERDQVRLASPPPTQKRESKRERKGKQSEFEMKKVKK